jgi:hypothetical protein
MSTLTRYFENDIFVYGNYESRKHKNYPYFYAIAKANLDIS